jgi:predicted nucleic acid-binding Zn ribbon protein
LGIWSDVVGKEIARHATAVALEDGVLLVRVDGSVWAQELSLLKTQIKEAFEKRLGAGSVRDIRFHSGQTSS